MTEAELAEIRERSDDIAAWKGNALFTAMHSDVRRLLAHVDALAAEKPWDDMGVKQVEILTARVRELEAAMRGLADRVASLAAHGSAIPLDLKELVIAVEALAPREGGANG